MAQLSCSPPMEQTETGRILDDLNRSLERAVGLNRVNEPFLWSALEALESAPCPADLYRLFLVRLTELALWCAAEYADAGELSAAGDLLVNPPHKFLTIKGSSRARPLRRHEKISDQAAQWCPEGRSVIDWLKRETKVHAPHRALLPELQARLGRELGTENDYVRSVAERQEQIASTIGFVVAIHRPRGRSLKEHLRLAPPAERQCLETNLCRFDLDEFHRLGRLLPTPNRNAEAAGWVPRPADFITG